MKPWRDEPVGRSLPLQDELILNQLEELADKLGIEIRYENVNGDEAPGTGGLCRLKGAAVLIIHSQAPLKDRIQLLIEVLRQFPIHDIYVRPVIRELLEG
jgi:hypothetical protein